MNPRRDIIFYDDILITHDDDQKLLFKGTLRSYVNAKLKLSKFFLYLRLVEHHQSTDTVPPILQIDFPPPGISFDSDSTLYRLWTARLSHCSFSLLQALRCMYADQVEHFTCLSQSYFNECIRILMIRQQLTFNQAASFIKSYTHDLLHANVNMLERLYYNEKHDR